MPSRRIAYLTSEYPAPSHTFIRREVEALRARGLHIETFSIRRPQTNARFSPRDQEAQRTTTYVLPIGAWSLLRAHVAAAITRPRAYAATLLKALHHRAPGARALLWSLFHFAEAIVLAAKLKERRIDHIHNHFAIASATVGLLSSSFLRISWSVTLHGAADWSYPSVCMLPEKIATANFVACVSYYGRAQASRIVSTSQWGKMFVARCGVDVSVFPPRRRNWQPGDRVRVITVGRLSPEKGQHGLLQAFRSLVNRDVDAELRIVGEGSLHESLTKTIAEYELDDRCALVGQKTETEVLDELADADLFVLSSFMEGLPVVLMEALGMCVPVIAPCVAGIPELVRHGETGLLFTTGDWDDLSAQLELLACDPELRRRLAERGRHQIVEEFEIQRAVQPIAQRLQ